MRTTTEMRYMAASQGSPLKDLVARALMETGGWSIEAMRAPGFRLLEQATAEERAFRAAAPLMEKAQVVIDKAVVEVGLQRLSFVADLMAEGLTYNLTDPLSVTQLEWYARNRTGAAQRVMNPSSRTENRLPIVLPYRLPIYLTIDGFQLDIRTLKMSERVGMPLDTTLVKDATRSVNEALEDAAINGATTLDGEDLQDAGYTAPGLLNAPNANTQALSVDWTGTNTVGTTGPAIVNDVQLMIAKAAGDKKYGPFNLYIGTNAGILFGGDYKTLGDETIMDRVQRIEAGGRTVRVRITDMFPGSSTGTQCALVQMTSDVVDLVTGQMPTVVPWTSLDGFTVHNLVMAIMVPRVRSDYDGQSGIVLGVKS